MKIRVTKHAKIKINQRNIQMKDIERIVQNPQIKEQDKFDKTLTHFVGSVQGRFLRVIGKRENEGEFLIISAFYDRRLKRRMT